MASYIIEEKGVNRYIVETTGIWDKGLKYEKKIKNYIGKIDQKSLKLIFKDLFIKNNDENIILLKGQSIDITHENYMLNLTDENGNKNTIIYDKTINNNKFLDLGDDLSLYQPFDETTRPIDIDNYKSIGASYFIQQIAIKNNLMPILESVFPKNWEFIFNLMTFIILENRKMDHCIEWSELNCLLPSTQLSSQNISVLFDKITAKDRQLFYKRWVKLVKENEFIALDITSISSYSKNNDVVEYGHSKDNDKIPQINVCMLFGEKTSLPIYQTTYNGSLTDVATLKSTLTEFYGIFGSFCFKIVLDRGFYSFENISYMLNQKDIKFILGVPLTNNYANELIKDVFSEIDKVENFIYTSSNNDTINGVARNIAIDSKKISVSYDDTGIDNNNDTKILKAFIYYNNNKAIREKNKFKNEYSDIKKQILIDIKKIEKYKDFIKKYMLIEYLDDNKSIVSIKENTNNIETHLYTNGFSILITNDDLTVSDCYINYVKKDVVEKSLHNYKKYLGLDWPYVHGNKRMVNKSFIIFICQILYCIIYKTMLEKNLFRKFSIAKMFGKLKTLQSFTVLGKKYVRPIPKIIKDIFKLFDIPSPKF